MPYASGLQSHVTRLEGPHGHASRVTTTSDVSRRTSQRALIKRQRTALRGYEALSANQVGPDHAQPRNCAISASVPTQ